MRPRDVPTRGEERFPWRPPHLQVLAEFPESFLCVPLPAERPAPEQLGVPAHGLGRCGLPQRPHGVYTR